MTILPPVINNCCPGAYCWAESETDSETEWFGPCWGPIEVIGEDYGDDWLDWIHGCEGHINR